MHLRSCVLYAIPFLALLCSPAHAASAFIDGFSNVSTVSSTVPANGDVNPYGVAVVPTTTGDLTQGNILISNFNNSSNLQGTGSTVVQITPSGSLSQFAQISSTGLPGKCPGGIGLTTALVALKSGFVVVGSLPTKDGSAATSDSGCLLVLDDTGNVVETIVQKINGPWDMTASDDGDTAMLFVTNVLNRTVKGGGSVVDDGTIVRIELDSLNTKMPHAKKFDVIGSGFAERTDPAALVVGPTGLGLSSDGTLFIADTASNRIAAISNALKRGNSAGTGATVSQAGALNGPLGLAIAPNGDVLSVNAGDGHIVETTPDGTQAAFATLDNTSAPPSPNGAGTLFGLAVVPDGSGVYFVDDGSNTLNLFN